MELQNMTKEDLAALYENEMTTDFPKAELKPLRAMLRLMDLGRYDPLLVTEGSQPLGYALAWLPEGREGALLEYFGVLRGKRNGGLGSSILALLADRYGQLFGEAEAPGPDASPQENDLRRRRIAFYERNGFRVLDYECALFGVRFHCLYRGPETDDRRVEALHRGVYAGYFSPAHMERYIQLELDVPLHVGRGEVPGVHAPVEGLHPPVVRLRAPVQAVEPHPEQGALIVQHPEAVALIEGDAPPAQVVLLGGGVRAGGLRLPEKLSVPVRQQRQDARAQPAVALSPQDAEIFQQRALPALRQPRQGVAQGLAPLRHQQGVVPAQVHQPQHGPEGLQLRLGEVGGHFVLIEGGKILFRHVL